MDEIKQRFNADDFKKGLEVLDDEIGKSEWLLAFAPITLLSAGGFLAVNFLRNRESTGDLDYLLEPEWAHDNDVKEPLRTAIINATKHLHFSDNWMNEEMAFFVPDRSRVQLFERAEEQNIVLWEGANLRILAVPLEWALERKLRRIHNDMQHSKRGSDMDDTLALLKYLREQNRGPLKREYIQSSNICSTEMPPDDFTMDEIAAVYRNMYNEDAFT